MLLKSKLATLTVGFMVLMMTVTLGLSNGYEAATVEEARINESVREAALANVSEPVTPAPNPVVPDHFESSEPRAPPPWAQSLLTGVLEWSFATASGIGVWTYRNRDWLPPMETMEGILNFVQSVWAAGVLYTLYRDLKRLRRGELP